MGKKQKRIAVADCETDPFDGTTNIAPFIWGYYDGNTYEEFDTVEQFIAFIYTLTPTILYAHNGGKFDWHFLLDYLDDWSRITIINGRISKFMIGDVEFRDSMNILPVSLKQMQKDEIDYRKMKKEVRHLHMAEIKRYLYHDCLYLYQFVSAFIETYGLHLTQATAALRTWEQMTGLSAPNDVGGLVYEGFSPFYYGGRCEAFEMGHITDRVSLYDVNSAYPYAMLKSHPFGHGYELIDKKVFRKLTKDQQGTCFIVLDCISRGAFPYRALDMSLVFPNDSERRTYYVTGWEYQAAMDTRTIHDCTIQSIYYFPDQIDFQEYILTFYERRKQAKADGDKAGDLFAKILMNSLYGKFGANPAKYKSHLIIDPAALDENGMVLGKMLNFKDKGRWEYAGQLGSRHLAQKPIPPEQMRYYNVATAASITGHQRALLWRAICQCKGVVYCDTDSIFARDASGLETGNELGQWKHEADFQTGAVSGKKLYGFEYTEEHWKKMCQGLKPGEPLPSREKIASKGGRLDIDDIYDIANGEEVVFTPMAPSFSVHRQPVIVPRKFKMQKRSKYQ